MAVEDCELEGTYQVKDNVRHVEKNIACEFIDGVWHRIVCLSLTYTTVGCFPLLPVQ